VLYRNVGAGRHPRGADRRAVTYRLEVAAERTRHVPFNDLNDPERIPLATEFSSVIERDVPIVCQHTRLDSLQAENALLSTIASRERVEASLKIARRHGRLPHI
jgi:hypothetical protein